MSNWIFILAQFSILTYALIGGVFLAFSDFIMRSLARTSGIGGMEAMQSINREVFRWVFMVLFLGMAPVSVAFLAYGIVTIYSPTAPIIVLAGLIYLFGCFGVTIVFNVPMNEALAKMRLADDKAQEYWTGTYLPRWTFWNSVRAVACVAASALLLFALTSIR